MHINIFAYTYTCIYMYIYTRVYIYIFMYIHIHRYTHMYMYTRVNVRTYQRINKHSYIYTCIRLHSCMCSQAKCNAHARDKVSEHFTWSVTIYTPFVRVCKRMYACRHRHRHGHRHRHKDNDRRRYRHRTSRRRHRHRRRVRGRHRNTPTDVKTHVRTQRYTIHSKMHRTRSNCRRQLSQSLVDNSTRHARPRNNISLIVCVAYD